MTVQGQNVWYDLMTTEVEGAVRFYTAVIGWETRDREDADPHHPYTMWVVSGAPIGGVSRLSDAAHQAGTPSHWIAYTTVDDVDATTARARALGGKVLREPFDVQGAGRVAVLADPQGAVFAIYAPQSEMKAPEDAPGHFSWAELNTTDYQAAWAFYRELFGWKERGAMDMGGPAGTYFMFNDATERTKGGMSNLATVMNMPPHWLHYLTVDDINATLERIKARGGRILNGPMPIPGDDVVAQCSDPQGALFAVYATGRKA